MKQLYIIFTFLLVSISGYCDTVDYWHVYVDDSLIAKFNAHSNDLTLNLKMDQLKSSDMITIRYGTDTPCTDCYYGLTVWAEMKRKLPMAFTREHFGKLSISIKELLDIRRTDGVNRFYFRYYEGTNIYYAGTDNGPKRDESLVLILNMI